MQLQEQGRTKSNVGQIVIDPSISVPVSSALYGLFFEDINFSADGGLNANLINNYSFCAEYIDRSNGYSQMGAIFLKKKAISVRDDLRHWIAEECDLYSLNGVGGIHTNAVWAKLEVNGVGKVINAGYPGPSPCIPIRPDVTYNFSVMAKFENFSGTFSVLLRLEDGTVIAQAELAGINSAWSLSSATLSPSKTGKARLEFIATGSGSIHLDEVQLIPSDSWGISDSRWSQGKMRADLVRTLAELKPTFMRFPGGCITEGVGKGNQYNWKQTIGPLANRQQKFNLWAESRDNGDYSQSFQLGFYEYFLLCEDLGMEPVPVVWAGLSCQFRSNECLVSDSPEFASVVQDAVDLIDWATGDPKSSQWARLRAEAGHPEPFRLNYIGIGNENHGEDYLDHFEKIQTAMEKVRPGMRFILAAGAFPKGKPFETSWNFAKRKKNILVDEHSYAAPSWFIEQQKRYDAYPRTGATVMVGEWAAYALASVRGILKILKTNTWVTAVAEAAFMTGLERNADIVEMACYAPLFANVDAKQWRHNLIDFDGFGIHKTANFQVQRLFGSQVGESSFEVKGSLPNNVFVCATGDKEKIILKLVNTGPKASSIQSDLPSAFSKAKVEQLAASPEATHTVISLGKSNLAAREDIFELIINNALLDIALPPHSVTVCTIS